MTTTTMRSLINSMKITVTSTRWNAPADRVAQYPGGSHWKVTIRYGRRRMTVPFSMGRSHSGEPDAADVLACLASDCPRGESFAEWCRNFGYDDDSRTAERTYNACLRTERAMERMFGADLDRVLAAEH